MLAYGDNEFATESDSVIESEDSSYLEIDEEIAGE
jgi:hypothetical protein